MSSSPSPLHDAIQNGDPIPIIKQFLSPNSIPSDLNSRGESPLHCLAGARACTKRVDVLNLLINHYITLGYTQEQILNTRDHNGNTVYHLAAKYKRYHLIRRLIELKVDSFAENNIQWLPIHYAANVSIKLIKMLVYMMDHCLELSGRTYAENVLTPVQVAAKYCATEALKKFRERKYSFRPHGGQPLLNLVVLSDSGDSEDAVKCIEYLLSIGVQVLKSDSHSATRTTAATTVQSPSPIHLAAQKRFPKILECLLDNQWNAIEELQSPSPLFHLAISDKKTAAECTQILLDVQYHKDEIENVIEFTQLTDSNGHTALEVCCDEGNTLVAEVILLSTYDLGTEVYWLSGSMLHKIYSNIPLALLQVFDLSLEQQMYKHAEMDDDDEPVIMDYSLITGIDTAADAVDDGIDDIELTTESSHLHQVVEQDKQIRAQILHHPLVKQYLHETWNKYNFLTYFCAVVQLVVLANYVLFVSICNCTAAETAVQDGTPNSTATQTQSKNWQQRSCSTQDVACLTSSIITAITIGSIVTKECFQLVTAPKFRLYFMNKYNMAQMGFGLIGLSSVVLVFTNVDDHALRLASVFGLVAVWFVAILQLQNLPPFGIYISIFGQVSRKSLKILLLFGLPTFLVFSQIFRLLIRKSPFHQLGAFGVSVKLLVLMIGELSFDETFHDDTAADATATTAEEERHSSPTTQDVETALALIFFAMFAFIATIVILNLLLAIAVDISQEVYSNAEQELAKCQLEQIYLWETLHPKLKSLCDIGARKLHLLGPAERDISGRVK